jgi:hypothetical protein
MILLGPQRDESHRRFGGQKRKRRISTLGVLLRGLQLAFLMKALVALAHRPAGLALREDVLNLGFAAREIAIGWFP